MANVPAKGPRSKTLLRLSKSCLVNPDEIFAVKHGRTGGAADPDAIYFSIRGPKGIQEVPVSRRNIADHQFWSSAVESMRAHGFEPFGEWLLRLSQLVRVEFAEAGTGKSKAWIRIDDRSPLHEISLSTDATEAISQRYPIPSDQMERTPG